MLPGSGRFNVVRGLINHHPLQVYHVGERLDPSMWDWLLMARGLVPLALGWWMIRTEGRERMAEDCRSAVGQ